MALFDLFRHRKQEDSTVAINNGLSLMTARAYPALENSAFWSCVTKLCRQYATMPWHLYQQNGTGRRKVYNTPLKYLMEHPCSYMTSYQWRFVMGFNYEVHGVAMAIIERKGQTITNLYPVSPRLMTAQWHDNRLYWLYGQTGEQFKDEDILRLVNTPIGYAEVLSPVDYASQDLEIAKNSQTLQSGYYKNGASIGGVLTVPRGTSKELKDQLGAAFANNYSGSVNAHKTMILEDSMKYEPIHLDESDVTKMQNAQSWTVDEVARRFGVPPFFCGDLQKATYANSEQQGLDVVVYALQPRFVAWESAFNNLCPDGMYTKFDLGGLMRGDHSSRSAFYHNGLMDGWLTINEVRSFEDLDPVEGGDAHYFPLNYGKVGEDGTIEQPAQTTANPFDLPAEEEKKSFALLNPITERRASDLQYLEEAQKVSRTNRQKIESLMRKQVKECIDKVVGMKELGVDLATFPIEFKIYTQQLANKYGEEYADVFKAVMNKLYPVVRNKVVTTATVNQDTLDAYAHKFGTMLSGRFMGSKATDIENCKTYEDMDAVTESWAEAPSEESVEETNRAGNAFQVFLFGQLGLTYMHVVAAPDACEFCQNLDGKTVEVNGNILSKGDESKDGQGNVRHISKNYKHPPFHKYCTCGIAPGEGDK